MPIKHENRNLYPLNWGEIRHRILNRAKNKCEKCGVLNGEVIVRLTADRSQYRTFEECDRLLHDHGDESLEYDEKAIRIVLTVAHLDHDPRNNSDDNLKALCQRCHLNYDRGTKTVNPDQGNLFEKGRSRG